MTSPSITHAARALLESCAALARELPAQAYAQPSRVMRGGTIGKHLRHTLDHFTALLDADAQAPIDYDHRARGGSVETNPADALRAIGSLRDRLASLRDDELARPVRVRVMLSGSGEQAEAASTMGRELAFAFHHAVHHQAMIRAIAEEVGHTVPEGFGKAPDTIRHERTSTG